MRKIGIRKFHQNMWKEIEDLPVAVTKRGEVIFVVTEDFSVTGEIAEQMAEGAKVSFEPDLDNPLGKCMWTKLVSGNRFNCDKAAVKKVDGIPVCEEHAS